MADLIITERSNLVSVANALRERTGETENVTLGQMVYSINEIGSQMQPDWNQNDETANDFIKNRPFYTGNPVKTVLLEEETVTVGTDLYTRCNGSLRLELGKTYWVNFNGIEYECVAWNDASWGSSIICIGNGSFIGVGSHGNGEPFTIETYPEDANGHSEVYLDVGESGDYTISISGMMSVVHQIDIKYIPSDSTKMDAEDPVCTGSFSMNRNEDSVVGVYSHVEGFGNAASGYAAHAEGIGNTASGKYSHVEGSRNIEDTEDKYIHIAGNGYGYYGEFTNSNAYTLDWNGVGWYQGGLQVGGNAQDDGAKSVMLNGDTEIVLASSTEGSTKKFKLTIDDDGVLTATEIVESVI